MKNLLESHPFDLQEVDLIVVGTVTPDMMYPSTACLVQHKLGIEAHLGFRRVRRLLGVYVRPAIPARSSSSRAATRKCWSSART